MVDVAVRNTDDPARLAERTKTLIDAGEQVAWFGRATVMRRAVSALAADGWSAGKATAAWTGDGRQVWIWTPVGQRPQPVAFTPTRKVA